MYVIKYIKYKLWKGAVKFDDWYKEKTSFDILRIF